MSILVAGLCVAACLVGCLKRKETLRVARDGSVHYEVAIEDDRKETVVKAEGPDPAAGWAVSLDHRTDKDGAVTWTRTGTLAVPPDGELPGRFVVEPVAGSICMEFPTSLTVEQRPEGTYYHFRRDYLPVPWQRYYWPGGHVLEEEPVKSALQTEQDQWDQETYLMVCRALLQSQVEHRIFLINTAMDEVAGNLPQDVRLRIRGDILEFAGQFDWSEVTEALTLAEEAREARLKMLGEAFEADLVAAAGKACAEHLPGEVLPAVLTAIEQVQQRHSKMESYGGQSFEIVVQMPGVIVGHNATQAEAHSVTFAFDGKAFRDRPHTLMVTSFVADHDH
jgi:hypothetical protein